MPPTSFADYLKEAAALFAFIVAAGAALTLFEYPGSPVRQAIGDEELRRVLLGGCMALVIAAIVYSPWGKRTGAHINPAVTLAFWRLGRIGGRDALCYSAAQFAGAIVATPVLLALIGRPFATPRVRYGTTLPGPDGVWVAFAAEFAISFVLMLVLLYTLASPRWKTAAGAILALLIALYVAVESPLSGMSLNPARTFGAALTAQLWTGLWLYFVAPVASMLLAAEVFRAHRGAAGIAALPRFPTP